MKRRAMASNSSHADGKGGEAVMPNQLEGAALGDVIWVESRANSWWAAQVVDESTVSRLLKPNDRLEGKILVRMYGCYTYMYADPVKCRSEFDAVLKQNNGCHLEIFQKALEQDRLQLEFDKSKAQGSKSKGASKGRKKSVELGSPTFISDTQVQITDDKSSSRRGAQLSAKKKKSLNEVFSARTSPRRKSNATEQSGQLKKQKPAPTSSKGNNSGAAEAEQLNSTQQTQTQTQTQT